MFLLGHACWSYLFSKTAARELKVTLPAYLALLAGVLPDFDIYFQSVGLVHHTWTHSVLTVVPLAILLGYFFGRLGFAFAVGILSHLVADSLVGSIPIFYPFYPTLNVGLNLGIPSLADTLLEMGGFGLVLVFAFLNGDYKLVTRPSRDGLFLAVPLVAIDTLTILFAGDRSIPLVEFAFSRKALTVITAGHIVLSGILAIGVLQGLVWYFRTRRKGSDTTAAGVPRNV